MKIGKLVYFEPEQIQQLEKEDNASELLRKLVREYYNKVDNPYDDWTEEERKIGLQRLDIIEAAKKQIKILEEKCPKLKKEKKLI